MAVLSSLSLLKRRLGNPSDTQAAVAVSGALLAAEVVLCMLIIWRVQYTEIDWEAYMDQTRMVEQGERDYTLIRGASGPLVYPAGFVWLFDALRRATNDGEIASAQLWFAAMYIASQGIALGLCVRSQVLPPWALVLISASKRIHSIWLLRLFNDGPATAIAACGIVALLSHRPRLAVAILSAGVSIKMHVLLLAPPVLIILLQEESVSTIGQSVAAGILLQLAVAAPFLLNAPRQYLSRAFELSRVFLPKWSVNLKFLPPSAFSSPWLAAALLCAHVGLLLAFASKRWVQQPGGLTALVNSCLTSKTVSRSPSQTEDDSDARDMETQRLLNSPARLLDTPETANSANSGSSPGDVKTAPPSRDAPEQVQSKVQTSRRSLRPRVTSTASKHSTTDTGPASVNGHRDTAAHVGPTPAFLSMAALGRRVNQVMQSLLPLRASPFLPVLANQQQLHLMPHVIDPEAISQRSEFNPTNLRPKGPNQKGINPADLKPDHLPNQGTHSESLRAGRILAVLFTGNLIGIVCARTLHYQFYSWYFYTLPLLLWWTSLPDPARIALWVVIEVLWNVFPSTATSSLALLFCHCSLLVALWFSPRWQSDKLGKQEDKSK